MKAKHQKGLAVVNAYEVLPSVKHFLSRMTEELKALGISLESKTASDIFAYVDSDGSLRSEDLPYDFVLFLDKDRYIARMLELSGLCLFNSARSIEICDDKMETYLALQGHGIRMPRTISGPLHYSIKESDEFLRNVIQRLNYPIVVKTNYGSQGVGVYLAQDWDELKAIEDEIGRKPRLYQEFIASSKGFDYRLIIVNGRFVAGYVRSNENDFRSNLGQGGHGIEHAMSPAQIRVAEEAAKIIGLDYCGVDLLESGDSEQPVLCEVNSNAFIQGAEAITGKNIAKEYAIHIYKTIYEE